MFIKINKFIIINQILLLYQNLILYQFYILFKSFKMYKKYVKKSQKGIKHPCYYRSTNEDKHSKEKLNKNLHTGQTIKRNDISTRCCDYGKRCPTCYQPKGFRKNKSQRLELIKIQKSMY